MKRRNLPPIPQYMFNQGAFQRMEVLLEVLARIYRNQVLKDQLSLIGGAALHLVHSNTYPPHRLTMDADFNFRNVKTLGDSDALYESRKRVDTEIKTILLSMGADESDIKIDAKYPLGRFIVRLPDKDRNPVSILIEIGYTKRIPLLEDTQYQLSQTSVEVTTPVPEELHAGKLAALFSRATPRDLFDVWLISSSSMDMARFKKCFIVECLASLDLPFFQIDFDDLLDSIPFNSGLQNLLPMNQYDKEHFNMIRKETHRFIVNLISQLSEDERKGVIKFYDSFVFDRDLIDPSGILHDRVSEYPALTWNLERLRRT
ncbi:MAG: nucleotidyl transferase AbiEii/AbiGii toxin family protein [Candidatus Thorarchaeota archaeon]